jgi:hypothetical protein
LGPSVRSDASKQTGERSLEFKKDVKSGLKGGGKSAVRTEANDVRELN